MTDFQPTEQELDAALLEAESRAQEFKSALQDDAKAAVHLIASHLKDKHHIKTIRGNKREVLVYRDGIYIPGEDLLKKEIRELLEEACSTHYSKEIVEAIKDLTVIERDKFEVDTNLINLENGVLDFRTGELAPHNPELLFFKKIPVNYRPEADCPIIKKYLVDVLDAEQILIVQEWAGYCLYRAYSIKKALICVGEGDTGKTTLINLLFAFLGEDNVSGVSLQKISSDKFAAAHLYGKHINLYDDLSFKDINDNGAFKIATGGGVITGEKKFGDQFQFKNHAKLTFACNKIPDVKDTNDEAYFKRWIVLQFNRVIEQDKRDADLIRKMTSDEELSGFLNFALQGLLRLLQQQGFSYPKEADEIKSEMLRSGSVIARFGYDCLEEATGEHLSKERMYEAFCRYASDNHLPAVSAKLFGSKLPMCFPYIAEFKPKVGGRQVTSWRNVRLKNADADGSSNSELSADEMFELGFES